MSRYVGPRLRISRALDCDLPGLTRKSRERRPQRPGQHGYARRRRESDYAVQLKEKQKLRFNYGLTERQMRNLVRAAKKTNQNTGDKVLELLERRLDNIVFRAGIAPTIPAARQLVSHKHVLVNGRPVNIGSFRVRVGDVITLRSRSRNLDLVRQSLAQPTLSLPKWLELDREQPQVKMVALPTWEAVPFPCDIQLVIEYYAR